MYIVTIQYPDNPGANIPGSKMSAGEIYNFFPVFKGMKRAIEDYQFVSLELNYTDAHISIVKA